MCKVDTVNKLFNIFSTMKALYLRFQCYAKIDGKIIISMGKI